jgi:hypothetical protein
MMLIILIVFALIFFVGMKIYQFDNSGYAKQTGSNYVQTLANGKAGALKKIYDVADATNSKLLLNVELEEVNRKVVADAICVNEKGIFVIQLYNRKGWITGDEKSYEWVEQRYKDKVLRFPNPVHENLRVIFTLMDLHPELKKEHFETVLVFSNDCSFQKVELESDNVEALKASEVDSWMRSKKQKRLTQDEVEMIANLLLPYAKNK